MLAPAHPLRFIPFRCNDLVEMCLNRGGLSKLERQQFRVFAQLLQRRFHLESFAPIEAMKQAFAKINPDADTRTIDLASTLLNDDEPFATQLEQLLQKANYEPLDNQVIDRAMQRNSLFKLQLNVDRSAFADCLIFARGRQQKSQTVHRLFGFQQQTLHYINYERVVLYIRLTETLDERSQARFQLQPGGIILKLFKDIPEADLEMLFPNTDIRMRLIDKLMIGIPAAVSGVMVITTKLGGTLLLLASLLGFWIGLNHQPVTLDQAAMLALVGGLAALGGYVWKQFNAFKNRKLQFAKTLTQNLYFRNLDNNAGVFCRLIEDAREEESKEALLAYYFLLCNEQGLSRADLDQQIETWLHADWQCRIDFEISDALAKLQRLALITRSDAEHYQAVPLSQAIEQLRNRNV